MCATYISSQLHCTAANNDARISECGSESECVAKKKTIMSCSEQRAAADIPAKCGVLTSLRSL